MKYVFRKIIILFLAISFLGTMTGCEAFVRKFTRKSKKDTSFKEEMVLVPEEYKGPQLSKEELYRQSYLFWESWHDELIGSLSFNTNRKKQLSSIEETIKSLEGLRAFLKVDKQKKLDIYISQLNILKEAIVKDLYNNSAQTNRYSAERIKQNILREFSYRHVKDYLI